ncbi:MAG: PEGA domain-containing protein [Patescibacteria group bacterium]|jgi:hypothetical protein
MTKKTRDYIFYLFIFFFVTGTILISLYASGYKFNLSWPLKFNRLLIKTGMIAVDTVPKGAVIYLNNDPQSNLSLNPFKTEYLMTAAKIKNVLPGEYTLRLEREGYWPFQKKIYVSSGQTTFAEDINLFRNNTPLLLAASSEVEAKLSASRKYLYIPLLSKMITLKNGEERVLPDQGADATWLNKADKLLSSGNIYGVNPADDANYENLIGAEAENWYLDENQNRLYYQNKNAISYLKLSDKTSASALSGNNLDTYEPRGDSIFFVASESNRVSVNRYSMSSQKIEQSLSLPAVGQYEFKRDNTSALDLYDSLNKTLYILNPDNIQNGAQTIKNVISWQWIDAGTLLYSNTWEIYRFNLKTGSSDLLTRVGEEIIGLIWNGDGSYLIFSTANSLNALDMKMNAATKIFQADKISGVSIDEKNNLIYFWAKRGQESGIYKMILQ